jgi:hypothetical protein
VDLIALVTACSLTVDPKLMHALVWHQSGGEPWSFSVPGERQSSGDRRNKLSPRPIGAPHVRSPSASD